MVWREQTGLWMSRVLAALLLAALPFGVWVPYHIARNSDGAFDDAALVLVFLFVVLPAVAISAGLAFLAYRLCRSRFWLEATLWCALVLAIGCLGGAGVGRHLWQNEFRLNRKLADQVVAAVETYRQAHGEYPEKLSDVDKPLPLKLRRGCEVHEIQYERVNSGGFLLRYIYGWPIYEYNSQRPGWRQAD